MIDLKSAGNVHAPAPKGAPVREHLNVVSGRHLALKLGLDAALVGRRYKLAEWDTEQ